MNEYNYNQASMEGAVDCARKANSLSADIYNLCQKICNTEIPSEFTGLAELASTLNSTDNSVNEVYDKLLVNMVAIKYELDLMNGYDANLSAEDLQLLTSSGYKIGGYGTYNFTENPEMGFSLWTSEYRYTLETFANSVTAKELGLTGEEALEYFVGVIISEAEKTPDGILSIVSAILNRTESDVWGNYYTNGTNPMDQVFQAGVSQYAVLENNHYQIYVPCVSGLDAVNEKISKYGDYTYDDFKNVVLLALEQGARNNDFTGWRSENISTGGYRLNPTEDTNVFHYSVQNNGEAVAEANRIERAAKGLDSFVQVDDDYVPTTLTTFGSLSSGKLKTDSTTNLNISTSDKSVSTPQVTTTTNNTSTNTKTTTYTGTSSKTSTYDTSTSSYTSSSYSTGSSSGTSYSGGSSYQESSSSTESSTGKHNTNVVNLNDGTTTWDNSSYINTNTDTSISDNTSTNTGSSTNTGTTTSSNIINNYYYGSSSNTNTSTTTDTSNITNISTEEVVPTVLENTEITTEEPIIDTVVNTNIVPEIHPSADPNLGSTSTGNKSILPKLGIFGGIAAALGIGAKVVTDKKKEDSNKDSKDDEYVDNNEE